MEQSSARTDLGSVGLASHMDHFGASLQVQDQVKLGDIAMAWCKDASTYININNYSLNYNSGNYDIDEVDTFSLVSKEGGRREGVKQAMSIGIYIPTRIPDGRNESTILIRPLM